MLFRSELIDKSLEERMQLAQQLSSMVLSLRKKSNLRVRQPLGKIIIPVMEGSSLESQIQKVENLILHEVNVKEIQFVSDGDGRFVKRIKPDFKKLGPKCGKIMKQVAAAITAFSQEDIRQIEKEGSYTLNIENQEVVVDVTDVEIFAEDIPGWVVANQGALTVALDITLTEELLNEGYARHMFLPNEEIFAQLLCKVKIDDIYFYDDVVDKSRILLQDFSETIFKFKYNLAVYISQG